MLGASLLLTPLLRLRIMDSALFNNFSSMPTDLSFISDLLNSSSDYTMPRPSIATGKFPPFQSADSQTNALQPELSPTLSSQPNNALLFVDHDVPSILNDGPDFAALSIENSALLDAASDIQLVLDTSSFESFDASAFLPDPQNLSSDVFNGLPVVVPAAGHVLATHASFPAVLPNSDHRLEQAVGIPDNVSLNDLGDLVDTFPPGPMVSSSVPDEDIARLMAEVDTVLESTVPANTAFTSSVAAVDTTTGIVGTTISTDISGLAASFPVVCDPIPTGGPDVAPFASADLGTVNPIFDVLCFSSSDAPGPFAEQQFQLVLPNGVDYPFIEGATGVALDGTAADAPDASISQAESPIDNPGSDVSTTPIIAIYKPQEITSFPLTDEQLANLDRPLTEQERENIIWLVHLKHFLASAQSFLEARLTALPQKDSNDRTTAIYKFAMPNGDSSVACVYWKGKYYITSLDVVKVMKFMMLAFGAPVATGMDTLFRESVSRDIEQQYGEKGESVKFRVRDGMQLVIPDSR